MKSAILVACIGLAISASQLVQSSSYASGYGSGYGGGADAASGGSSGAGGSGGERPKVNLGISLKVPAMKINLGRMNMPRISIRAKIKQSHGPKVINVPEMHIDTNSKIPGPEGAHAAHGGGNGGGSGYESSYGSSSYGSSGYSSSNGYESPPSSYGQSDSYSSSQSSSYGSQPSSYEQPQPSYEPQYNSAPSQDTGSYGQQPSYGSMSSYVEPAAPSYDSSYSSQATPAYEHAASTYDDSSSPTSYGNQNYASQPQTSMYGETASQGMSSYRAPSNYMSNTRQYGSTPSVYQNQMPYSPLRAKSYQTQSIYSAPRALQQNMYVMPETSTAGYSNGYSGPASSYSNAIKNAGALYSTSSSYGQQPAMNNQYSMGYSRPANQYSTGKNQYHSNNLQSASNGYAPNQAVMSNSYSSPYAATNSAPGYSPIEPGSTMLSASNDNYDGLTRVTVASSPARDQSYGQNQYYGQQQGYQPSSYQTQSVYQKPSYQPQQGYSAAQPTFDDNISYSGMSRGNYGNRMNNPFEQNGYIKSH